MQLGQASTTMSGGEAQRVKLASELGMTSAGHTLYVLDEPTTGLHFADVHRLLGVLQRLASNGHTLVVIEHNLDVIKCADWIVDLGPEGGDGGGTLVAQGTPEAVAATPGSFTGEYLARMLGSIDPAAPASTAAKPARAKPASAKPASAKKAAARKRATT
jgi:excinuclease ABC subunit A